MDVARYKNDCTECVFLGVYKEYDLYLHNSGNVYILISDGGRFFGGSNWPNFFSGAGRNAQAFRAAYSGAIKAGYTVPIGDLENHRDLFPDTSDKDISKLVEDIRHGEPNVVQKAIEEIDELSVGKSTINLIKDMYDYLDDPFEIKERIIALRYETQESESMEELNDKLEIEAGDWKSLHLQGNAIIDRQKEELKEWKQCCRDKSNIILELHDEATEQQRANKSLARKLKIANHDYTALQYKKLNANQAKVIQELRDKVTELKHEAVSGLEPLDIRVERVAMLAERERVDLEEAVKRLGEKLETQSSIHRETVKRLGEELKTQATIHKEKRDELEGVVQMWKQSYVELINGNIDDALNQKEYLSELVLQVSACKHTLGCIGDQIQDLGDQK